MTRTFVLCLSTCFTFALGCGGIAIVDDGAGGEGGSAATSKASSSRASTSTKQSSSATKQSSSATKAMSSNQVAVSSGGFGHISPFLEFGRFGANCMPGDPPGLLRGSFVVTYLSDGTIPAEIQITDARLEFENQMVPSIPLHVTPKGSGVMSVGQKLQVEHEAVPQSVDPGICALCNFVGTLLVTYGDVVVSVQLPLECSF